MKLLALLGLEKSSPDAPPEVIRELTDIRGVRVIRLRGEVGKDIAEEASATHEAAERENGAFQRPLLIDFAEVTKTDFSTVAFLVQALRRRMAAGAPVGIMHPPAELIAEIEIAKLDGLFRVFTSEEEALNELSGGQPAGQ